MNYLSQLLFFIGAIGAFNSLIVALYFLWSKYYTKLQNKLFGLFLLVLSLRVIKSLFYSFSTDEPVWILQSGPAFFLLVAPLLFSYVLSFCRPRSFWIKYWKHHILFWVIVILLIMVFLPFGKNVVFNKEKILPLTYLQWLLYLLTSIYYVFKKDNTSNRVTIKRKWLFALLATNLIIWLSFAAVGFDYFITGSIIFSGLFYCFFLFFLLNRKTTSKIFEKDRDEKQLNSSAQLKEIMTKVEAIMSSERLYSNPNLKITDVAEELGISPHELSKFVNGYLGKNFTEFINTYRIEEAKKLLLTNSNYTIEGIGNQSGFNSKSAFYKAFKTNTGVTPTKFKTRF